MFYALPKELVIKRKNYLNIPRNPYDVLYTDKYNHLINDDVFLQLIWESYAWSVWQFIQVPRRDGYGNIPGKWTDYSGDFPLWRLCFVIQNHFRKKFEYEMEWSFQKLYLMPKEMQIPWLTYQQFSNLIGNLTDMIVEEQNWQPMIDEVWQNRQMEDYSERKSTYKRDFINKWYCNVYSVTESCKKAIGFSATNITVNCGVYHIGCADAATSASALHAVNELCINGGEVLADCESNNNVFAISAEKITVNSGTIVARASESVGSSCGIYGDVSVYCGDVTATGEDSAFNGNLSYVSDKCKISASDKHFSDDLTDGSLSSGAIRVPSANNAIAKTARVYYDMNGQVIYAYALADNLSYRGTTRLIAHCENPRVMFKYESSNNFVIKVEDSIFGFVKAVNSGTATIKVTATDLLTGEPIRDADGNIASATVEIKCTMTFWEKIIRFFRSIFGLD